MRTEDQKASIERENKYNKELLTNTFNSLEDIELNDGDMNISDLLSNENKSTFRNKPAGFKYELSERNISLIPRHIQKGIVDLANAKVQGEQEKFHPEASNSSEYTKKLEELSPQIEKYLENVQTLKSTIPNLDDSMLSFRLADDLKNGATGKVDLKKPIKNATFKSMTFSAERDSEERQLSNELELELNNSPVEPKKNSEMKIERPKNKL